jgi:hypothetical protein
MKAENFAYWLQGYFEILNKAEPLSLEQVECIKRHLSMVFYHDIDPKMGNKEHQKALTELHSVVTDIANCGQGITTSGQNGNSWHICPDHLPVFNC